MGIIFPPTGIPELEVRGGEKGAAGWSLSRKRREGEADRAGYISQGLPLPHSPEPTAGSGLIYARDGSTSPLAAKKLMFTS